MLIYVFVQRLLVEVNGFPISCDHSYQHDIRIYV